MPLIEWDDDYLLHIAEIDEQHKHMFTIVNRLYDLINVSKTHIEIQPVILELVNYARFHFETEEKYFKEFNYEETEAHVEAHNAYRKKIDEFLKGSENPDFLLPFKVIEFLEDWWVGHINGVDRKYAECFKQHGLT
jgi:hemerythrin-like metal-binding protein